MRNPVIDRELEHLGVDHDQPALFGGQPVKQRQHHRVDRHRLARAGRAGDQQMRHAREIDQDRRAADILAEHENERPARPVESRGFEQLAERHGLPPPVGHLDADHAAPGHDRGADRDRAHRTGDIVGEPDDAGRFRARRGFEFVERHHRARTHPGDRALDAEIVEHRFEQPRVLLQRLGIDARRARRRLRRRQQLDRRRLVGRAAVPEVEPWLAAAPGRALGLARLAGVHGDDGRGFRLGLAGSGRGDRRFPPRRRRPVPRRAGTTQRSGQDTPAEARDTPPRPADGGPFAPAHPHREQARRKGKQAEEDPHRVGADGQALQHRLAQRRQRKLAERAPGPVRRRPGHRRRQGREHHRGQEQGRRQHGEPEPCRAEPAMRCDPPGPAQQDRRQQPGRESDRLGEEVGEPRPRHAERVVRSGARLAGGEGQVVRAIGVERDRHRHRRGADRKTAKLGQPALEEPDQARGMVAATADHDDRVPRLLGSRHQSTPASRVSASRAVSGSWTSATRI